MAKLPGMLRLLSTRVRRATRFTMAHKLTAGVVLLLGLGPPVAAAWWLDKAHDGWGVEDWVSLAAGLWTSFWFLVLALIIGVDSQRRARALANAEVSRTVGALAVAGSRSFAGADSQALSVPSDALAALHHYEAAGKAEQRALLTAIQTALSDVIFGTTCRADTLPRSTWDRLSLGTENLQTRLTWLFDREPDELRRDELGTTRALVLLCRELGNELRQAHWSLKAGGQLDISHVLRRPDDAGEQQDKCADVQHGLNVLKRLYSQELAVVKEWAVLDRCLAPGYGPTPAVRLAVTLEDVRRAEGWFTPWYAAWVRDESDGRTKLQAVNVNEKPLDEAANEDELPQDPDLPPWPTPLLHSQVPIAMRRGGVERARALLKAQPEPVTICSLVYEFAPATKGEPPRRLVLDGNHRIAGALRLSTGRAPAKDPVGTVDGCPVRVLAFTIQEQTPVVETAALEKRRGKETETWTWEGFTPDVENARIDGAHIDEPHKAKLRARQEVKLVE